MKLKARRKRLVDRKFQGQTLGYLAVYWLVYHAMLWVAMFVFQYGEYRRDLLADNTQPVPFAEFIGGFTQQHIPFVICALAVLPIFLFDLLKITHRVSGPVVNFKKTLKAMVAGEETVPDVKLRKQDYLKDLEAAFNEYLVFHNAQFAKTDVDIPVAEVVDETAAPVTQTEFSLEEQVLDELCELQEMMSEARENASLDSTGEFPQHDDDAK